MSRAHSIAAGISITASPRPLGGTLRCHSGGPEQSGLTYQDKGNLLFANEKPSSPLATVWLLQFQLLKSNMISTKEMESSRSKQSIALKNKQTYIILSSKTKFAVCSMQPRTPAVPLPGTPLLSTLPLPASHLMVTVLIIVLVLQYLRTVGMPPLFYKIASLNANKFETG